MRAAIAFLPLVLSIEVLLAQKTPIGGPIEGFIFDLPTMSLRPVVGSLGAASLGKPVIGGLAYASVAPTQKYALTFQDGRCSLIMLSGGSDSNQTSMVKIPGSFAVPDGVAWSGDGSAAILYSRTGNWIQVLSGLPAAANTGPLLSIAPLGGALSAVATDVHGEQIAIGLVGETAGIYRVANGMSFVPMLALSKPIALAFSDDGGILYAVDGATNQVSAQTVADLTTQSWPLDGLADPSAIVSARDAANRAVIYVAGRKDHLLVVYDASTHGVLASVQLGFQPNLIQRLGVNSFLLGSRTTSEDILWSFTNAPQPVVYFVPAQQIQPRGNARK